MMHNKLGTSGLEYFPSKREDDIYSHHTTLILKQILGLILPVSKILIFSAYGTIWQLHCGPCLVIWQLTKMCKINGMFIG